MAERTTRRFFKTHFPIKLLPKNVSEVGGKIVYIARNPKDVAVSYYHYHKVHPSLGFTGDFESFVEYFMNGLSKSRCCMTDTLITHHLLIVLAACGPYWEHVLNAWSHRNDENVFFIFYENLKVETEQTLRKLADFLEKPISDDDLPKLLDHLEFKNFKSNPSVNYRINDIHSENGGLVRRGEIGGNPEMTAEIAKKFDDWISENLKDSDLRFPHCN